MGVLPVADLTLQDQLLGATRKNQSRAFDEARATIAGVPLSTEQKNHLLQIIGAVEADEQHN